ncbi:MAG: polysaccharide biosynthesis tyrosine autokinase [Blautia sp.]|nr:polysaccharide biosynthesis tyrosine autokinase [Blautia sp.]
MSEQQRTRTQSNTEQTASGARSAKVTARTAHSSANQLDLLSLIDDVVKGLMRHWLPVLVTLSVLSSVFFWYGKNYVTPVYQASCTFLVNTSSSVNYSNNYYSVRATTQIANTFPYIIKNDALQDIIEEDLGVSEVPGTITTTALQDTNMMTINVQAESGQMAYDILQSVLRNYSSVAKAVLGETDLTIMNESGVPGWPINAVGGRRYALYGFLAGLLLWIALFALTSYFKKTIRQENDFNRLLSVKCLGSTPKVRLKKRTRAKKGSLLITDKYISYGFTEGIRTLRTRIERDHSDTGNKVYLVSSALAGEGKSTISANLALSLAGKNLNVALLDLDLRNASILKVLGREEAKTGLSELLMGNASLEDIMITDEDTGLVILPAGHAGQNTLQAINSDRLAEVFEKVRRWADYIIVDTPPSSILSDAASFVQYADGGIFVVRQDYAPIERIKEGIELLSDTGLSLTGCVLNYTQAGITGYVYGYGYGYGSGRYGRYGRYGYGYGNSRSSSKRTSE